MRPRRVARLEDRPRPAAKSTLRRQQNNGPRLLLEQSCPNQIVNIEAPCCKGEATRLIEWELGGLECLPRDQNEVCVGIELDVRSDKSSSLHPDELGSCRIEGFFRPKQA